MTTNGKVKHEERTRIPVAYLILGYENNRNAIINFYRNAKSVLNFFTDASMPEAMAMVEWVKQELSAARERGVKCKTITDITIDNLHYCKKIMSRIDELRHLDGLQAIFGVTDTEVIAMVPSLGPREERDIQFIQSDSESVVQQKQMIFDALWTRATPAQSRIDELEGKRTANVFGDRSMATIEERKNVIDRIYLCKDCHLTFVYASEVEYHKKADGHENFREYPLV